ncbi:uncharacterized protein [Oryza sativa Japonica Group]|uniref:uncharacterized protein isoform X5 n=1 Tax=Oryza sativa subsp. japonica TaxID=39947 RepID=UPI000E1BB7E8|nr:uncharacterized protein LOC4331465 isoform X5 [Oryza sativa Japonica Group]XP_052146137.1 uncharacterized protein LOC127765307 isoform X1 [Oryza glaberrima]
MESSLGGWPSYNPQNFSQVVPADPSAQPLVECRTSHLHCNTQDGSTSRSSLIFWQARPNHQTSWLLSGLSTELSPDFSDNNRPQEHPVEAFLSKIRGKVEAKESCTRQPDPTEQRQTTKRPSL